MPAAAFILMALEAARQLCGDRNYDADAFRMSNVQFEQRLPLSNFPGADAGLEVQLIARRMEGTDKTAFEIFSQSPADEDSWTRHCYGNFEIQAIAQSPISIFQDPPHDQALLDQARTLEPSVGVGFRNLKLGPEGSSGEFERGPDDLQTYAVHPSILTAILKLPPLSVVNQNLPAEHHISSIASITVPVLRLASGNGRFTTRVKPLGFCSVRSDIEITQCERIIALEGVNYTATKVIHPKPALNALFFKSILLPDIKRLAAATPISISRSVELLTHKWPMCDIKINDVPEPYTMSILEALGATDGQARLYFRSMKCSSIPSGVVSDHIQLVDNSDLTSKYHFVITQDASPEGQLSEHLHSGGFLCIPKAHNLFLECKPSASFEFVCDISGLGSESWVLLRKATAPNQACIGRRVVLFTNEYEMAMPSLNAIERMESVPLEPAAVVRFCEQSSFARFDAIVIDTAEKSVITAWTGSILMPWVQILLKSADSILWVTQNSHISPFANIAGSLLRTLQSEQPSLKVSWLVIDETANKCPDTFASRVEQAFVRMVEGENELVTRIGEWGPKILRYLPDDDLSADTGLSLPRKVRSPLGVVNYSLGLAAPGEPVILSYEASSTQSLSGDAIEVVVEASLVDIDDLHLFNGKTEIEISRPHSGYFFAGRVLNSQHPELPPETRVVGWHPNHTHRKKVGVWFHDVCRYPSSVQPSQAVSRYAAIAVASCVVDGAARARQGETFILDIRGLLSNIITQLCNRVGAIVLNSRSGSKPDFVVTFQNLEGIRVNERPIGLDTYLQSNHGREMVQRSWQDLSDLPVQVDEYDLGDYQKALETLKQPCSTVLLHRNLATIVDHVPIYKKAAQTFRDDANYIVIGGLGGLGRFICSWMIEKGAKHMKVISRSGAGTREAKEAISAMNVSGASIECIKADACGRQAMSRILSRLRSERPIKGIINLAMVLGDAPMATMTADEWDRGLHVKIDSSWILHEETLQDHLDFFILFSSIASVLGNRSQGNYNVANAFLNALAEYRQSLDLPGISVALGAMSKSSNAFVLQFITTGAPASHHVTTDVDVLADMGVLYSLSKQDMLQILNRSGLTHLTKYHLAKIMEAAILESPRRDRSMILTGLNLFEREANGSLAGRTEPLFWTDWPEFGHLQQYKLPTFVGGSNPDKAPLRDQVAAMQRKGDKEQMRDAVRNAFLTFLSQLLGFGVDAFDPSQALMMYGIDSLSGVSCQYWFHKGTGAS